MIHLASQPMRHKDPIRALAAAVILEALKDYSAKQKQTKDRALLRDAATYKRRARAFFFKPKLPYARAFNLQFCCEVLDLDQEAVREAIRRRRLDQEALELLTREKKS